MRPGSVPGFDLCARLFLRWRGIGGDMSGIEDSVFGIDDVRSASSWITRPFAAKHSLDERRRLNELSKLDETGRLGHFRGYSVVHLGAFS